MQKLLFEASWDKTIAVQDRQLIENIFHQTNIANSKEIQFTRIREAVNHKGQLLVTVLVHNFTEQPIMFTNTKLQYKLGGQVIAEQIFSLPLMIPSQASMPWTFIFEAFHQCYSVENGQINLI